MTNPEADERARGTSLRSAVLITDPDGRVLLTRTAERWRLPAAGVAAGETPRQAGIRAVARDLGLAPRLGDLLVCEWSGGRLRQVHDGGRISPTALRRLADPGHRSAPVALVAVEELPERVSPPALRRITAALGARRGGRTAYLENGRTPPVQELMRRYGIVPAVQSGGAWVWHEEPVPPRLPIRQAWVWVFAPDGRVVVYLDDSGMIGLPGGTLEDFEHRDPAAAAVREVMEETQISITEPVYLGHLVDRRPGGAAVARVRMAAAATAVGPAAPDPATGTTHRRLLVPPGLVGELCGWGWDGERQAAAALAAAKRLAVPEADPAAGTDEIPPAGMAV